MKENFNKAFDLVLGFEGGAEVTDDPNDRGGLTKYGISQRAHPDIDIRALTLADAKRIYKFKYWDAVGGDHLPPDIDLLIFDMAINHGSGRAVRFLQRSYNAVRPLSDWPIVMHPLVVDGRIGQKTLSEVHILANSEPMAKGCLLRDLLLRRSRFYARLIRSRSQRRFIFGWMRQRVVNLAVALGVFSPNEKI